MPKPRCSVTIAIAGTSRHGSLPGDLGAVAQCGVEIAAVDIVDAQHIRNE
jgi:hypothetical protein